MTAERPVSGAVDTLEADVRARATRLAARAAGVAAAMLERSGGDIDVYALVLAAQGLMRVQQKPNMARQRGVR